MYDVLRAKDRFEKLGKLPKRNPQCTSESCKKALGCPYSGCCFGSIRDPLDKERYKKMRESWRLNND